MLANNGDEAVNMTTEQPYDLILMDVEMPVMSGLEATRRIRQHEHDRGAQPTPIIGLSAYARQEQIDTAITQGMTDYLTKPCRKDTLLPCLMRHLHR